MPSGSGAWTVAWPLTLVALTTAMSAYAGATLTRFLVALAMIYAGGYVTGSLLVAPKHDRTLLSLGIVRLAAGLLLTSVAFLFSLELSLPWFSGPLGLFALAVMFHGHAAFDPPRPALTFGWNGAVAGLVALVLLAPPVISAIRMAPGTFPPVFFNVDTPYFLEQVHSLVGTQFFPPDSLGVLGGRRAYHLGFHGIAALISRGSGIAPHHAVFLIVVPLLAFAILAAAVVLARAISPALPALVSVPLLLVPVPMFWYDFWLSVWPRLGEAISSLSVGPLDSLTAGWEMWGVTSNIQNLGGTFLVLASLGAIANAPSMSWRLPSFLIGSAFLFKSPAAVALVAGFSLAQVWRSVAARSLKPLMPGLATAAVFGAVYGTFWILPGLPGDLRADVSPLFYLEYLNGHGGLRWFAMDIVWLLLPALVVLPARLVDQEKRSLPLLLFAVVPFVVVNLLRLVDLRHDVSFSSMNEVDWLQVVMPVPLLMHAFVLSVVGQRWTRLGPGLRAACLFVIFLAVLPSVFVAARYGQVLLVAPETGHEFADNRAIGAALAAIPKADTLIVTNDLRYPADGFERHNLQMQIPALFGHQAFAANYVYEVYPFSEERRGLQRLLEMEQWTPAIDEAARTYRWTHLLIRKDYAHPDRIPLEQIFDNEFYSVFRFDGGRWSAAPLTVPGG